MGAIPYTRAYNRVNCYVQTLQKYLKYIIYKIHYIYCLSKVMKVYILSFVRELFYNFIPNFPEILLRCSKISKGMFPQYYMHSWYWISISITFLLRYHTYFASKFLTCLTLGMNLRLAFLYSILHVLLEAACILVHSQ